MNPSAMFDYMGHHFLRNGFAHVDNVIAKRNSKQSHGCSCQACKETNHTRIRSPHTSMHRNSAGPSGTYLPACVELSTTLQNPATLGNSGTCLHNLHQHTPELAKTPSARTLHNSPLPSGTDPHRHTPELSWAEDPISLRCRGKIHLPAMFHPWTRNAKAVDGICLDSQHQHGQPRQTVLRTK